MAKVAFPFSPPSGPGVTGRPMLIHSLRWVWWRIIIHSNSLPTLRIFTQLLKPTLTGREKEDDGAGRLERRPDDYHCHPHHVLTPLSATYSGEFWGGGQETAIELMVSCWPFRDRRDDSASYSQHLKIVKMTNNSNWKSSKYCRKYTATEAAFPIHTQMLIEQWGYCMDMMCVVCSMA